MRIVAGAPGFTGGAMAMTRAKVGTPFIVADDAVGAVLVERASGGVLRFDCRS